MASRHILLQIVPFIVKLSLTRFSFACIFGESGRVLVCPGQGY